MGDLDPKMKPINGTAARVVFGESVHYEPKKELQQAFTQMPPLEDDEQILNSLIKNSTGRKALLEAFSKKFGRLKVVGISKMGHSHKGSRRARGIRLVCRCDCGHFVIIRRRPLVNGRKDRCGWCDQTQWLQSGAKWQSK